MSAEIQLLLGPANAAGQDYWQRLLGQMTEGQCVRVSLRELGRDYPPMERNGHEWSAADRLLENVVGGAYLFACASYAEDAVNGVARIYRQTPAGRRQIVRLAGPSASLPPRRSFLLATQSITGRPNMSESKPSAAAIAAAIVGFGIGADLIGFSIGFGTRSATTTKDLWWLLLIIGGLGIVAQVFAGWLLFDAFKKGPGADPGNGA